MSGKRVGLIWARVSEDKGQDVEGQVRELARLAERMGLDVPEEFIVRVGGESAFKGDPPQKREVLLLAKRRRFDVLLVWSLDRWSRRRKDGAREVFTTLPACGVSVVSHEEPWLTTEGVPDVFRETLGHLMLWLAEEESKRKSARVRLRYQSNANRAEAGGGRARWGRGRVPTKEDRDSIVALARAGASIRSIAGQTGVPKSTVARVLSQTSGTEGGSPSPGASERPEGALGTPPGGGA